MRLTSVGGYAICPSVRQLTFTCRYRTGQPVQLRSKSSSSSSSSPVDKTSQTPASSVSAREETKAESQLADTRASSSYQPPPAASVSRATSSSTPSFLARPFIRITKLAVIGRIANAYARAQDRRPYWTQVLSTLVIYLCADLTAQLLLAGDSNRVQPGEENEEPAAPVKYDPLRTLRHITVGVVAAIPVYKWFMLLENNFNYSSRLLSIATKVVISQCCFTPSFNTYFFSAQSLLAGASLEETWERLKVALPKSVINSLKLWPAVTAFSFAYIDPRFRGVFAGCVVIGWQSYLSWLNQQAARQVDGHGVSEGHEGSAGVSATRDAILQR